MTMLLIAAAAHNEDEVSRSLANRPSDVQVLPVYASTYTDNETTHCLSASLLKGTVDTQRTGKQRKNENENTTLRKSNRK